MKTLTIASFTLLVVLQYGAALKGEQQPKLTRCSLGPNKFITITNVTLDYKRASRKVDLDAGIRVNRTFGSSPALEISVMDPERSSDSCDLYAEPEELRLCDGKTRTEKKLTSEWNNECPIRAGVYNAYLSFKIRPKSCAKDSPLVVTLKIRDEGTTLDCVSFRLVTESQ
ncbi:uncharacterized protein LOC142563600 [Dermacentor variabilis]|uniref:uncharacterized protein LOC142563600 n=1 Tax=Dermacentor variabilis TaxID=34621 RepID=UPI003F5C3D23